MVKCARQRAGGPPAQPGITACPDHLDCDLYQLRECILAFAVSSAPNDWPFRRLVGWGQSISVLDPTASHEESIRHKHLHCYQGS